MRLFYLKSCSRCKGDLLLDKDKYGFYIHCIQCGCYRDIEFNFYVILIQAYKTKVKSFGLSRNGKWSSYSNKVTERV